MRSIVTRLNLGFALSWIVLFVVLGVAVSWTFRSLTQFYVASRLEHDAESLLMAVEYEEQDGITQLSLLRLNPIFEQPYSGHYFRVVLGNHTIESRSLWDWSLGDLAPVGAGEIHQQILAGPDRQKLLIRTAGYLKSEKLIQVTVAEDLSPMRQHVHRIQLFYFLGGVIMLMVMMVWQRLALRSGLRPLRVSARELKLLETGRQQQLNEDVPVEIQPFVVRVNTLITALQQRVMRSRQAMGNLAHALKTPLTRLNQLSDNETVITDPDQREEIHVLLARMQNQIDAELKRARLMGGVVAHDRIDLGLLLKDLTGILTKIYSDKNISYRLNIEDDFFCVADKEDMSELFGNLLDNAAKWASHKVSVTVNRDQDGRLSVTIEDDGPGVDEDKLPQLFARGRRLDEKGVPGHGLGLSIVEEVVQQYSGRVAAGRSTRLGGFLVEVIIKA